MKSKYKLVSHPSWEHPILLEQNCSIDDAIQDIEDVCDIVITYLSFEEIKVKYGEKNASR